MSTRIYVAAPWADREKIPSIAQSVEALGLTITHKWWEFEGEEEDTTWEFKQVCAAKDIKGVRTADIVLLLNSEKSEGKAIEQGLAIAYGIPILCVGDMSKRMNIFQTLDNYVWVETVEQALQVLQASLQGETFVAGTESM